MRLVVIGTELPGRRWCDADGRVLEHVHVGVQVGKDPAQLVAGDAAEARWTVELRVVERDGVLDLRGPAVHGTRGDRFVYLTWGDVDAHGFHMFRRAKLMLDRVDGAVMRAAHECGVLTATVSLTDAKGGPRCARVDPPAIAWRAG